MKIISLIISLIILLTGSDSAFAKKEKHSKKIPPGLQKKINRGGSLPPGWQKKLKKGHHIHRDVRKHETVLIPLDKKGIVTVKVDGKIIRLIHATNEILEILK